MSLDATFSELFETDCEVVWIPTGTAANSIILAHFVRPWQGILCYEEAHIEVDECGAPTFYSGGAKLMTLPGRGRENRRRGAESADRGHPQDVHQVQPAAISITNATEYGLVWRADEIGEISQIARANGMKLHMDGARFANAVAYLGLRPRRCDLARRGRRAVVWLHQKWRDDGRSDRVFRRQRWAGGARTEKTRRASASKGRFVAAQIRAMLTDDLWLDNARAANAGAATLARRAATG